MNAKRILSQRSENNLEGVNEELAYVVRLALQSSEVDFTVVEGVRTIERQKELVAKGASRTMNSYHIPNEHGGRAVDLYPFYDGKVQVKAPTVYWQQIAKAMKQAAREQGVMITWGGDWKSLVDMPHYQIEIKG